MKTILFGISVIFASAYLGLAEVAPLFGTESDVTKLTQYMLDSKEGKAVTFPLVLKYEQVQIGGVFNGISLRPDNNSLLTIVLRVRSDNGNGRTVVYFFTVEPRLPLKPIIEPQLPLKPNASDHDWPLILKNRKVTQYQILEYLTMGGKTKKTTLYLSVQEGASQ